MQGRGRRPRPRFYLGRFGPNVGLLCPSFVNRRRQKHYGGQESTTEDKGEAPNSKGRLTADIADSADWLPVLGLLF